MANVEDDTETGGKMEDFEHASAHILPKDLVIKRKGNAGKRNVVEISDTTVTAGQGNQK